MKLIHTTILLAITFFYAIPNNAQEQIKEADKESFQFEIIHSRKLKKVQASTIAILRSDKLKTIYVKFRMSSSDKSKKEFDINKFSLVYEKKKIRSRPIAISYQDLSAYTEFQRLSQKPLPSKLFGIKYDPDIKDSFADFDFDGYTCLEVPMNYGGFKRPKNYISYFKPRKFKTKKLNFFFPFPKDSNKGALYYGDKKVFDLNF